jgi:hypothetical protein
MAQVLFEKSVDKLIQMLQNDVLKKKIQILVLEPFLQYCIELLFPYVIIICVIIGSMILLMIAILGILVYKQPLMTVASVASVAAAAASA